MKFRFIFVFFLLFFLLIARESTADGTVDIRGLDKMQLLKALWENSSPASFFAMTNRHPPPFDEKLAVTAVQEYIDYFEGRMIKCDLSKDFVDPWLYDRDLGNGAFQRVARKLRTNDDF
jgi:hypothetical protein